MGLSTMNQEEFSQLWAKYLPRLSSIAQQYPDPEDVLQAAALWCWEHQDEWDGSKSSWQTWAWWATRRVGQAHRRASWDAWPMPVPEDTLPDPGPTLDDVVAHRDEWAHWWATCERIRLAMGRRDPNRLTDDQYRVLGLVGQGHSQRDVEKILGVAGSTVRMRLRAGREKVIRALDRWGCP